MAAKEHPCRQGGPLGLSRERAAQPDLAWEATPERRINSAGKFLALSASSASLQLAAARITQSSATLVPALRYITPPDHCRQSRLCRQPKSPKLPSSVHSAKASSATQKSCMIVLQIIGILCRALFPQRMAPFYSGLLFHVNAQIEFRISQSTSHFSLLMQYQSTPAWTMIDYGCLTTT
jgi:hypothetical protein